MDMCKPALLGPGYIKENEERQQACMKLSKFSSLATNIYMKTAGRNYNTVHIHNGHSYEEPRCEAHARSQQNIIMPLKNNTDFTMLQCKQGCL